MSLSPLHVCSLLATISSIVIGETRGGLGDLRGAQPCTDVVGVYETTRVTSA